VGYKVWSSTTYPPANPPGTKSVDFTGGDVNSGNYFLPVTFNGNGWNLVGNPYPSAVDWDLPGWIKSKIDATVYVWDGAQYLTWNGTVGDLTGGVIPAMQAFFVKATGSNPLLVVSNSTRSHGPDPYKSEPVDRLLELTVNGNGYSDQMYVNFNELATVGFDTEYDAYKLMGIEDAPQLYTRLGNDILKVSTLPAVYSGLTIPVALEVPADGEYSFAFDGIQSFNAGVTIYLEDMKEDKMIEITQDGQYVFNGSPADEPDRFMLHFGVLNVEEEVALNEENDLYHIYSYENTVYVQNTYQQDIAGSVTVYNIMGQEILSRELGNTPLNKFTVDGGSGYYIVKVISGSGVYSEKVFIK
jgi:hypothetical protein